MNGSAAGSASFNSQAAVVGIRGTAGAVGIPGAEGIVPTRTIHEQFCCNRGFAATTTLHAFSSHAGGGLAGQSINVL